MKPSTLVALAKGDIANAIVSATPGGIEAQEAAGQQSFVADETLPIKCNFCTREQLEEIGIQFGDPVDDLFVRVKLPTGWKKVALDHSMWSKLVDEQGRERATIFYKAAFYDRSAHINLSRRFAYHVGPICGYDDPQHHESDYQCAVMDCGDVVWTSDKHVGPRPQDSAELLEWMNDKDNLENLGEAWLAENYPDWENTLAYWD